MMKQGVLAFAIAGAVSASVVLTSTQTAEAGGFAIREQSSSFLGSAFAGAAAGYDLSSTYWNPAAITVVPGTNTESHAAIIIPDTEVTGETTAAPGLLQPVLQAQFNAASNSTEIADPAFVPSSYAGMQMTGYDSRLFLGFNTNSSFGLVTKPEDTEWAGATFARKSKLFHMNANPIVGYQIMPGVSVGAGVQVSYLEGTLKFASGAPGNASTLFDGDDIAFGATAGILVEPRAGTRIGLGWRSAVHHTLDGRFATLPGLPFAGSQQAEAEIELPDIVTLSVRQAISPTMRLMATFEWTNWSSLDSLVVKATETGGNIFGGNAAGQAIAAIPTDWDDSWFASLGFEMDYSQQLTLRGGLAYEESPIQKASSRILNVPDTDRIWLSAGATYKWSEKITLDLAYTHIFFDDGDIVREDLSGNVFEGEVENSTDIIAASFKYRWDTPHMAVPLK